MKNVVSIDTDLCENEQVCHAICPEDVFILDKGSVVVANPRLCTVCFKCQESCPSGAIELDY